MYLIYEIFATLISRIWSCHVSRHLSFRDFTNVDPENGQNFKNMLRPQTRLRFIQNFIFLSPFRPARKLLYFSRFLRKYSLNTGVYFTISVYMCPLSRYFLSRLLPLHLRRLPVDQELRTFKVRFSIKRSRIPGCS